MKLQQATQCALLAALHLASRPGQQVTAGELAEIYGISQHHLAKVLRTLSHADIVGSTRGAGGGCVFSGDPRRITLFDIISLFEPDFLKGGTPSTSKATSGAVAELAHVLSEVDRLTSATLQSVSLQTIISNAERNARKASSQ
ncbi:MAG: Rrf2 family transcriptional regulator [Pseudomonadota bacterium]